MNESWLGLNGKTVIVTGGASGIGKAVAQEFLNVGCNVVVSDMAPEAPEFDTAAGRFHYVKTDVTSA
ncbi:SDR family NAD(P)-dependent oxidoreductase, partial [Anaerostipes hominis (ex Lee et al. 2021)]